MLEHNIFPFPPDHIFNLFSASDEQLDSLSEGAYVLLRTKEGAFEYPAGHSRIFYIGESVRGIARLSTHRYHATRASREFATTGTLNSYWWPRYGFAGSFGAEVWWFQSRATHNSKQLESLLVDNFYWRMGAIPIANGKWPGATFADPDGP